MRREGGGNEGIAGGFWRAMGKSEFGVCGVVGGMMVIELLAGKMRLDQGGMAAGEMGEWNVG